jgi:hypothetical protein
VAGPDRRVLHFTTTAKASADAHALRRSGFARFDLIVDSVAIALGIYLLASGNPIVGALFIVIAVLSLFGTRFHPLQRAVIAYRFRGVLGQPTEVTVDQEGVRFENPLATSFLPWSSINVVRWNSQTLGFFRGRVLLGYIPSSAFESPEAQVDMAAFAREQIAPA